MIDLHSHLLPGIDDGPRTWKDSIELCRAISREGVSISIATPHLIDGVYNNTSRVVEALVRELNQRLQDAAIPLTVLSGAEVDLSSRHVLEVTDELPRLGDGAATLIEMPAVLIPAHISDTLFRIRARGIIPVLAHPERNEELQRDPKRADEWLAAGAALQLDAESLIGIWGRHAKECAERLLSRGSYHPMASDAHSTERRPPRLMKALTHAQTLVEGDVRGLVENGPRALLRGILPDLGLRSRTATGPQSRASRTWRWAGRFAGKRREHP